MNTNKMIHAITAEAGYVSFIVLISIHTFVGWAIPVSVAVEGDLELVVGITRACLASERVVPPDWIFFASSFRVECIAFLESVFWISSCVSVVESLSYAIHRHSSSFGC